MRTKRQQQYDRFYYGFERWILIKSEERKARKALKAMKFDKEFYENFRTVIRPYWARYGVKAKLLWAKYNYMESGSTDPRYLLYDVYAGKILPHFNNHIFVRPLADKNLTSMVFPTVKRPETVFKYMSGLYRNDDFTPISRDEAMARLGEGGPYFIKPTRNSAAGHDIRVFQGTADAAALEEILAPFRGYDYLIQKGLRQHPALAALNPSSVNTVRLITLLFRGEAHVLSACLRVGEPGSQVDNMGAGGLAFEVLPDGRLGPIGCTPDGNLIRRFPIAGNEQWETLRVPGYDRVYATALELAARTPHLNYVAWDFAVDEAGDPVLIEFNVHVPGQNQEICGPTFADLTDEVLAEVFSDANHKP